MESIGHNSNHRTFHLVVKNPDGSVFEEGHYTLEQIRSGIAKAVNETQVGILGGCEACRTSHSMQQVFRAFIEALETEGVI